MHNQDKKDLAKGVAALCVYDAWNDELCDPLGKSEEIKRYMKSVMDRLYTVMLCIDDPDFNRKLVMYGSLMSGLWGNPEEVKGILDRGFISEVDGVFTGNSKETK